MSQPRDWRLTVSRSRACRRASSGRWAGQAATWGAVSKRSCSASSSRGSPSPMLPLARASVTASSLERPASMAGATPGSRSHGRRRNGPPAPASGHPGARRRGCRRRERVRMAREAGRPARAGQRRAEPSPTPSRRRARNRPAPGDGIHRGLGGSGLPRRHTASGLVSSSNCTAETNPSSMATSRSGRPVARARATSRLAAS